MLPSLKQILATRPDPLAVLSSTAEVVAHAQEVRIDPVRVEQVADALAPSRVSPPAWNYTNHFFDAHRPTASVHYIFLLDALNFCFWGSPKWGIVYRGRSLNGYWALAAALKRAALRDPAILSPQVWAELPPSALAGILQGQGSEIPLFIERWRHVRELGRVLTEHWSGSAVNLVRAANRDAGRLARLVADNFSSFADTSNYRGRGVYFYKRAQILVGDLYGSFGGARWGAFDNLDVLTCFADYKLPQILRAWGILRYSPPLARRVDAQRELAKDSESEIEIRAATIWAVEFLREALQSRGRTLMSVQVDWYLWEASQARLKQGKPYHRVRTEYY